MDGPAAGLGWGCCWDEGPEGVGLGLGWEKERASRSSSSGWLRTRALVRAWKEKGREKGGVHELVGFGRNLIVGHGGWMRRMSNVRGVDYREMIRVARGEMRRAESEDGWMIMNTVVLHAAVLNPVDALRCPVN